MVDIVNPKPFNEELDIETRDSISDKIFQAMNGRRGDYFVNQV